MGQKLKICFYLYIIISEKRNLSVTWINSRGKWGLKNKTTNTWNGLVGKVREDAHKKKCFFSGRRF